MFDYLKYDLHILKLFQDFNFLIVFVMIMMEVFLHVEMLIIKAIFINFIFFIVIVLIKVEVELILSLYDFHFVTIIVFDMNYLVVLCHIVNYSEHLMFELSFVYVYYFTQFDHLLFLFYFFYPFIFILKYIKQPLELHI